MPQCLVMQMNDAVNKRSIAVRSNTHTYGCHDVSVARKPRAEENRYSAVSQMSLVYGLVETVFVLCRCTLNPDPERMSQFVRATVFESWGA